MAYRFYVNPDGLSYIDLATLYANGEWQAAINAYWSPLYPLLIGLAFKVLKPGGDWEAPLVHMIGFAGYLLAFVAFRFFLRVVREIQDSHRESSGSGHLLDFRKPVETFTAHALFHLSAIAWIGLENLTPDMLVAAVAFTAAGVSLRAVRTGRIAMFAVGGALAGIGYLTKAIMFPVDIVFCAACAVPSRDARQYLTRAMVALVAFVLVSAPQIVALSREAGKPTYGAVGNLAYSWLVNKTPLRWTGRPAGTGTPAHPIRRLDASLPAFEFSYPQPAYAYPFWDIPAHWREGIESRFDPGQQVDASAKVLVLYAKVFGFLIIALVVLFFLRTGAIDRRYLPIVVPGAAALGLYALVHAEPRLIGPWPILVFVGIAASLRFSERAVDQARKSLLAVSLIAVAVVSVDAAKPVSRLWREATLEAQSNLQLQVADALRSHGVQPGSKVAAIEASWEGHWAHLAGVQIAMEVVKRAPWRAASDSARAQMLRKFREHGAVAVVELRDSTQAVLPGWKEVGGSRYSILTLTQP